MALYIACISSWPEQVELSSVCMFQHFSFLCFLRRLDNGFFRTTWLRRDLEKPKKKTQNNEHMVPRQFTSNRNEHIGTPPKHGETVWNQKRKIHVGITKTTRHILNTICCGVAPSVFDNRLHTLPLKTYLRLASFSCRLPRRLAALVFTPVNFRCCRPTMR